MAYSAPFVYTRILGTLGDGLEEWGVGFKIPHSGSNPSQATLLSYLTTIEPAIGEFHTQALLAAGNSVRLTTLTAALVGTDGLYVGGGAQSTTELPVGPYTGAGTSNQAWATSMVLSLRTPTSRGRAAFGKMYWPVTALGVNTATGQWSTGTTASLATAAATMLNSINQAASAVGGFTGKISVMSNIGAGVSQPVTHVLIGGKPDHQERREKNIEEVYSRANLVGAAALFEERRHSPIGS